MVVLNCGIGLLTPPVGAVLFIGSAVSKVPMERVVKATLPFYVCMIITLLLITFIPAVSMWLPSVPVSYTHLDVYKRQVQYPDCPHGKAGPQLQGDSEK